MSLDVTIRVVKPTEVYSSNITHNLGKMADQVQLSDGNTLYKVLWRPDECVPPYTNTMQIADLLHEAWKQLISEPDRFKPYNPENGWGSYENLVSFVKEYRDACYANPTGTIYACR